VDAGRIPRCPGGRSRGPLPYSRPPYPAAFASSIHFTMAGWAMMASQ
jgi:hypothetical protein